MAKRYVILDESPEKQGNDDFILVGLKKTGFALGCPMLFGGSSDKKDGPSDKQDFSLKVIKREVKEETQGNIVVIGIKRLKVYPNNFNTYTSTGKDFEFTGKVSIDGEEFRWIRKVSKGKLKDKLSLHTKVTKNIFAQILYQMTLDTKIEPTDNSFEEYETSNSLDSLYVYCEKIGIFDKEAIMAEQL
jgi:hypothetical protein